MIASQTLQQRQEDKDWRREQDVKDLENHWFYYGKIKKTIVKILCPDLYNTISTLIKRLDYPQE